MSLAPPKRAALIVNANSRLGRNQLANARRLLRDRDVELTTVRGVADAASMSAVIEEAVQSGVPMVIVGGGDGTLRASVKHFVGSATILGILPLGTANSFARALGHRWNSKVLSNLWRAARPDLSISSRLTVICMPAALRSVWHHKSPRRSQAA